MLDERIGVEALVAMTRAFPGPALLVSLDRREVLAVSPDLEAALPAGDSESRAILSGYVTDEIREVLRDSVATRATRHLSEIAISVGGEQRFVDMRVRPITTHDENSLVLIRIDDASTRVSAIRSEQAARSAAKRADDRYRLLFEFHEVGIMIQSPSGDIEDANPAALALLGVTSLDELHDRDAEDPAWQAIGEDGVPLPRHDHPSMVALRTRTAVLGSVMRIGAAHLESTRWLRVSATPLFDDGDVAGVFTTFEDITESRRLERLATELERARHETALRAVEDAMSREREEVRLLQQAVMPRLVSPTPKLDASARYLSASRAAPVGGDWFDIVELEPGSSCALVVGDVTGHGVAAARTMIQLRHWTRLLALSETSPARALAELNRAVARTLSGEMATVLLARLDFVNHTISWATAGHPPLIVGDGTDARALFHGRVGCPIGVAGDFTGTDQVEPFEVGDTCVAYTDGLIERRGEVLDHGIAAVVDVLRTGGRSSVEEVCDDIVATLLPRGVVDDDACVVVVRRC